MKYISSSLLITVSRENKAVIPQPFRKKNIVIELSSAEPWDPKVYKTTFGPPCTNKLNQILPSIQYRTKSWMILKLPTAELDVSPFVPVSMAVKPSECGSLTTVKPLTTVPSFTVSIILLRIPGLCVNWYQF